MITLLAQPLFFLKPAKASAIPVVDAGVIAQLVIANISLGTLVGQSTAANLKTFTLDGLAWMLAKMIVQQITVSTVNWINSGFEGSPAFVENPGSFFLDVADQATGQFITGGLLADMCSPFSIDIKIALSFKYRPYTPKRYACTISTIMRNMVNAGKNASINGFTAGDFKQGGWPAFASLTTEPQNNIYGSYLQAESDLSFRVASIQGQKKDELGAGRGFLSKEVCTEKTVESSDFEGNVSSQLVKDCKVQTPGSVIAGTLDNQLASAGHSLELADSINEIVGALFAQLVTKVLQGGLGGSSGGGAGDSESYMNQVRDEIKGSSEQVESIKVKLLDQIKTMTMPSSAYMDAKTSSLNLFLNIKGTFDKARSCYAAKIIYLTSLPTTPHNSGLIQQYRNQISTIDSTVASTITPLVTRLQAEKDAAYRTSSNLTRIENTIRAAATLNDLIEPSQTLSQMETITGANMTIKTQEAKNEYEQLRNDVAPDLNQTARSMLNNCLAQPGPSI